MANVCSYANKQQCGLLLQRTRFACLVSEPQALVSLTLCVFAVWVFEPHVAREERQARKHGHEIVLLELGLATTPQQASAKLFCKSTPHFVCVVSHNLYAGNPSFRACSTLSVVVAPFMVWHHR